MNVHFLGTGGAVPSSARQNTSLLLDFDFRTVLIDCSGTPVHTIRRTGASLDALTDVVLTHAHVDHVYAVPSLLHSLWLEGMECGRCIRLHALQETHDTVARLVDVFNLRDRDPGLSVECVEIDPEEREALDIRCGEYSLGGFRVRHGAIEALGMYIDAFSQGKRLVFSADATVDNGLVAHVTDKTSVLIQDCGGGLLGSVGHAGAEGINELIRGTAVERVYLTHVPSSLTSEEEGELVARVGSGFDGIVAMAQDGDRVEWP